MTNTAASECCMDIHKKSPVENAKNELFIDVLAKFRANFFVIDCAAMAVEMSEELANLIETNTAAGLNDFLNGLSAQGREIFESEFAHIGASAEASNEGRYTTLLLKNGSAYRCFLKPVSESGKLSAVTGLVENTNVLSTLSFNYFRSAFEEIPLGVVISTLDGKFIYTNKEFNRWLGYDAADLIGLDAYAITHPDDIAKSLDFRERLLTTESSLQMEKRYQHKDGERFFWGRLFSSMIKDDGGNNIYYFSIIRDITEKVILKSEQRKLLSLVENSVNIMGIFEPDGSCTYINKKGVELLGIEGEADRLSFASMMCKNQHAFLRGQMMPLLASNGRWTGEHALTNMQTNEVFRVENNAVVIPDTEAGGGESIGMIMRDLTREDEWKDALKRSEQNFKNMVMQAPVAMAIFEGDDLLITVANHTMLALWNKTEADILNRRLIDVFPEFSNNFVFKEIQEVYQRGVEKYGQHVEVDFVTNNISEQRYYTYVFSPLYDNKNKIKGVINAAIDVTEQTIAKRKIQESEEKFKRLILEAPMATALYKGKYFEIEVANEAMIRLWGKDESVIGKKLIDALPELKDQPFIGILNEVFESGVAYHTSSQPANLVVNGQLQTFWFNFTYKPIRDEHGQVIGIINSAVDITEQALLQKQKDEFLGIASHELRTPVTSIKAYTQVLESIFLEKGNEQEAVMLGRMDKQINKLTNLIDDLLDVTKIQAGKMVFNNCNFNLNDLAAKVVADFEHLHKKHEVIVELSEDVIVLGDRDRIGQVMINLLTNAAKFSPDADKIVVRTKRDGEMIRFSVQDFGVGISAENQTRLFEQFYRVHSTSLKGMSGLGLGLFICREIISRQQGKMTVESKAGEGSTFSFSLPFVLNH